MPATLTEQLTQDEQHLPGLIDATPETSAQRVYRQSDVANGDRVNQPQPAAGATWVLDAEPIDNEPRKLVGRYLALVDEKDRARGRCQPDAIGPVPVRWLVR